MALFPPKPKTEEVKVTAEEAAVIYEFLKTLDPTTIFTEHEIEISKTELVLSQIQEIDTRMNDALLDEAITTKTKFLSEVKKDLNVVVAVDEYVNDYMSYMTGKESPTFSEFKKAITLNV